MIVMSLPDDLTIERHTDLDIDIDELWELVSTSQGWASWLVDDADITVAAGAHGTAEHDGVERSVRIDTVADRRGIEFSWWDHDDPASGSFVQLEVVALPGNRSHLHVTERFVGASASTVMSASMAWDIRLVSLWLLLAVQSFVTA